MSEKSLVWTACPNTVYWQAVPTFPPSHVGSSWWDHLAGAQKASKKSRQALSGEKSREPWLLALAFQLIRCVNKVSVLIGSHSQTWFNQSVIWRKADQTKVALTGQVRWINIKSQSYRLLSSFNFLISSSSVSTTYDTQSKEEHWLWCFCLWIFSKRNMLKSYLVTHSYNTKRSDLLSLWGSRSILFFHLFHPIICL